MGGQSCQVPEFRKAAKIITFSFQAILISIWLPWGVDDVTRRGAELRTADRLRKRQLFPLLSSFGAPDTKSNPSSASVISATSVHHTDDEQSSFRDRQMESAGGNLPEVEWEGCRYVRFSSRYPNSKFNTK